jgi:MFS family permease
MQIFISYKRQDQSFAERLREMFLSWGHQAWLDVVDIPAGTAEGSKGWDDAIHQGMKSSQVVVGVLTPESLTSENVLDEWGWALTNQRRLFLLWLRDVSEEDIPPRYIRIQRIDVRRSIETGLERLQRAFASPVLIVPTEQDVARAKSKVIAKTAKTASPANDNRTRMLTKVRENWIHGVLDNELRDARFQLGMELKPDAVLKHADYGDYVLPNTSGILDVFDEMGRELLILGAPGAGKTMLMLQLAEKLLDRADTDETKPIPVIFNLASWAEKQSALKDWLVERLFLEYQVPRKVSQRWLENELLLLLLDGLDEVKEEVRSQCVDAINAFRQQFRNIDMVVCSRIADYELLTSRLSLQSAITLQPLTENDIDKSLEPAEFTALREVVTTTPAIRAMAETPFLMNTMLTTYRGASRGDITPFVDEISWRNDLFEKYVFKHFHQQSQEKYTLKQVHKWLYWLARKMEMYDQRIFYIEGIQPWWLETARQKLIYRVVVRLPLLLAGTLFIIFTSYFAGGLLVGFIGGLLGALIIGLLNPVKRRELIVEKILRVPPIIAGGQLVMAILGGVAGGTISLLIGVGWEMSNTGSIESITISGIAAGLIGGLVGAIVSGIVAGILASRLGQEPEITTTERIVFLTKDIKIITTRILASMVIGILVGLILAMLGEPQIGIRFGLVIVAVTSAIFLLASRIENDDITQTPRPNQRIFLSLRTCLIFLISMYLAFFIPFFWLAGPILGIIAGLIAGIGVGWAYGGGTCTTHSTLRLLIAHADYAPLNYARFLDFCASIGIMRKVGGGYIFQHRMLLEYFASLYAENKKS